MEEPMPEGRVITIATMSGAVFQVRVAPPALGADVKRAIAADRGGHASDMILISPAGEVHRDADEIFDSASVIFASPTAGFARELTELLGEFFMHRTYQAKTRLRSDCASPEELHAGGCSSAAVVGGALAQAWIPLLKRWWWSNVLPAGMKAKVLQGFVARAADAGGQVTLEAGQIGEVLAFHGAATARLCFEGLEGDVFEVWVSKRDFRKLGPVSEMPQLLQRPALVGTVREYLAGVRSDDFAPAAATRRASLIEDVYDAAVLRSQPDAAFKPYLDYLHRAWDSSVEQYREESRRRAALVQDPFDRELLDGFDGGPCELAAVRQYRKSIAESGDVEHVPCSARAKPLHSLAPGWSAALVMEGLGPAMAFASAADNPGLIVGVELLRCPVDPGSDWDSIEAVWRRQFCDETGMGSGVGTVLLAEPPFTPAARREAWAELLFGKLGVAKLGFVLSSVLPFCAESWKSFGHFPATGVAVEVCSAWVYIVPFFQGYLLAHIMRRMSADLASPSSLESAVTAAIAESDIDLRKDLCRSLCFIVDDGSPGPQRAPLQVSELEDFGQRFEQSLAGRYRMRWSSHFMTRKGRSAIWEGAARVAGSGLSKSTLGGLYTSSEDFVKDGAQLIHERAV